MNNNLPLDNIYISGEIILQWGWLPAYAAVAAFCPRYGLLVYVTIEVFHWSTFRGK